jgi:hypothetical protein
MKEYHVIIAVILMHLKDDRLKMPSPYLGELEFYIEEKTPEKAKQVALSKLPEVNSIVGGDHIRYEVVDCEPMEEDVSEDVSVGDGLENTAYHE